ncbi:efflux RND transporter permease subunit [Psychrobacter sp. FME5]|uniref:efflux RND transporter permease subunit n=1 Tax=Psychrobacter sp. FME5 TaxID=2487706 RepID=UPI0017882C35|nr:efflux RND transporter permease subunit [Psychrobacter sp. FME5]MBE0445413.1 efflux RND transporter permease subunit [Psychrobacter sp. FME5]MDN5801827.1 efflux RND transporter permease subunit [Psychrobacter sp.]MDN5891012.1 efflux RND transporter permease subunit [Psychrobacter sp.]
MSRFFIDRPIFAWVMAILVMLIGIISVINLPIEQYPRIAPPTISVSANYPGANAQTVEDSVVQIIEQRMKGLDGLMYMSSSSSSNGGASVTLTFENGTDPDTAQVQVQNKLQAAMSSLPEQVQRQGVNVNKSSSSFLMVQGFISENGEMDKADIADYINSNVVDPLSRVEGVGEVQVFGSSYAMRIWLDPARLRSYNMVPSDVVDAVRAQNAQVSAGQLGQAPADSDQQVINATVTVQSYLQTADEFKDILLRTNSSGAQVRLGDVADVEIGSENYSVNALYNGKESAGLGISLAGGANALETRELVGDRMAELEQSFPAGLTTVVPYDTTPFVRLSIEQVVKTLIEAIILVFIVMFIFLQNWRATIIPTLAVPVVLLGTFAVLYLAGFSINVLTMFALVLSIGLLVDDAIVVVENVERILEEDSEISIKDATIQSMGEISKIVVGIALILSAVFVPMAFFGGATGVIYRQFAITLITSMVLSALVALIFTPALCVTLLKRSKDHEKGNTEEKKGFFGWFNRSFAKASRSYENFVGKSFRLKWVYFIVYAVIIGIMAVVFLRIPSSFLPEEDQGIMFTLVQLPAGATLDETDAVLEKVNDYYESEEDGNVESVFTVSGFSFAGQGQNMGLAFVRLTDWADRKGDENTAQAVAERAMGYFFSQNEAQVFAIVPPAITELGNASGFDLMIQDNGNVGHDGLLEARNMLLGMAGENDKVTGVRPNGQEDAPQLKVNVNQEQAAAYGLSMASINSVISTAWGSSYINDFVDRGRIKRVFVQGEPNSRTNPNDIGKWYVRNDVNNMIPFDAFSSTEWQSGSPRLTRYNSLPSMNLQGGDAPGLSTGDAMDSMEAMMEKLPDGVGYEWTGMSLEEKKSGAQAPMLYAISILVVFLCLAALYESWSIPFSVLLVIPLGVLGAVLFTWFRGFSNDVYLQVGLLTVVGLSAKNAILIIEFARDHQEDEGYSLKEAVMTAARQRLRPIIMTSLAFGLGVVPLFIATGAGSGSQNAIGTSVVGGVVTATILGVFFIPMFYIWVRSIFPYKGNEGHQPPNNDDPQAPTPSESYQPVSFGDNTQ